MGYYPHGSKFFSDLTHYVRSGDFVEALLRDSTNVDEYAFAIGAMAHYVADSDGHRLGTNLAEPLLYPPLERKYGNVVTYEDDPLLDKLATNGFHDASPQLRSELLHFYSEPAGPDDSKLMKKKDREKLESNLRQLKVATATAAIAPSGMDLTK